LDANNRPSPPFAGPSGMTSRLKLPGTPIDRTSPLPFYAQLADILEQQIVDGQWPSGWRIPGELEICEHFGLSRSPVRQALARLQTRGLIERRKGQGTFVQASHPGLWLLQASEGFFQDEVDRLGRTVTSSIIRADQVTLSVRACEALELPAGSNGVVLERLRSIDDQVALYVVNHLPERMAGVAMSFPNPNESLYRRLRDRLGVEPSGGRRKLQAVAAGDSVAALLELPTGAPVAFIESVTWDADLRPFDYYQAWLRPDRVQIDIYVSGAAAGVLPLPTTRSNEEL
jgi:GntR family transcriptional regulator